MIQKINNLFSDSELKYIHDSIESSNFKEDNSLGRIIIPNLSIKKSPLKTTNPIIDKVNKIVNNFSNLELSLSSTTYAEYSSKYGQPNLPPHFDADDSKVIVNFQLESNTSWKLGLNLELYSLENNSALIFNPNTNIHWRPIKNFNKDEYVKLIFFRFYYPNNINKTLSYSQDHEIFKDINNLRNSL